MARVLVTDYSFDPHAGTVTLTGVATPVKEQIRSVYKGTELIYSASDARNASLVGKVLTLPKGAVGSNFSASDSLVIMYDSDPGWASSGTKYLRPGGGIPATDLATGVQTSLGKADASSQVIAVATPTGVGATDNANIVAAQAAAAALVASGGRPVVQFRSGTYQLTAPIVPAAGVSYRGIAPVQTQAIVAPGSYLADGEFTVAGGTVLKGDGTFACFQANQADLSSPASTLGQTQISTVDINGFAIDTFTYGLRIGAKNVMGLVWSKLDQLYIKNCSVWGVYLINFVHMDIGKIETVLCQNGMYFANKMDANTYQSGNSNFQELYHLIPQDGRERRGCRGIVFSSLAGTGSGTTSAALNELEVGRLQVNGYNRTLLSVAATFTNASTSVGVPDGTKFLPGMLVNFTASANGFTTPNMYVVKTVAGNVLTLATSNTTAAIASTGTTGLTLQSYGFPNLEITSENTNARVATSRFAHIDTEGVASAGVYLENVNQIEIGITSNPTTTLCDVVTRNAAYSRIYSLPAVSTDFDANSSGSAFFGARKSTVGYPMRGIWLDTSIGANAMSIGNGFNANPGGDIMTRAQGFLYPMWGMGERIFPRDTSLTLQGYQGGDVIFNGATGQTFTLPTIVTDTTPGTSHIGCWYDIWNVSANTLTVVTNGTQLFNKVAAKTSLTIATLTGLKIIACKDNSGNLFWAARAFTLA